jgi:hypothetical protein
VSEEQAGGTMEREEHFGHVVLRTNQLEVYSLDLYETRGPVRHYVQSEPNK